MKAWMPWTNMLSKETEHIKMVDGRIYCPFEAMVKGIDDPILAYQAIVKKMNSLGSVYVRSTSVRKEG